MEFDVSKLIPKQPECNAESLVGSVFELDGRDVSVFGIYGEKPDVFFLLKWDDTGNFFSQDFYSTMALMGIG